MDSDQLKAAVAVINAAVTASKDEDIIAKLKEVNEGPSPSEGVLRETKAGATINRLKKNKSKEIQNLANEIIAKWKAAVDQEKKKKRPAEDAAEPTPEKKVKTEGVKTERKEGASSKVKAESAAGSARPSPAPERPAKRERKYSTIDEHGAKDRSAEKDAPKGLEPLGIENMPDRERPIREKGVTMCYDALAFDNLSESTLIVSRAIAIEYSIYEKVDRTTGNDYRSRLREMYLHLREANAALRDAIVRGETIQAKDVINLSRDELANETIKAETAAIEKANLFAAQGAGETEAETFAFKCGKCGQNRTRYYQMQTRSADEPMTTFVTCINCSNKWKFS